MKQNSRKNQRLIKQYPFVMDILDRPMLPIGSWVNKNEQEAKKIDDLTICVQKADGNLMYRRADNVAIGNDYSYILRLDGSRKDLVGRRGEYLFAVDGQGKIINRVDWPSNDAERRATGEVYGKSVFCKRISGFTEEKIEQFEAEAVLMSIEELSKRLEMWEGIDVSILAKVQYLVWVTIEAWHWDTHNDSRPEGRLGDFHDRSAHITIYKEPDGGFEKLLAEANVFDHLYLDTRTVIDGVCVNNPDIIKMNDALAELCVKFQNEVYFAGMKDVRDKGKYRGASGQFNSVKVLCTKMCGYDRVMLEDAVSYITFQLRPGERSMYVLGLQGTLPQVRNLVNTVTQIWNDKPELRFVFKSDENVSVM